MTKPQARFRHAVGIGGRLASLACLALVACDSGTTRARDLAPTAPAPSTKAATSLASGAPVVERAADAVPAAVRPGAPRVLPGVEITTGGAEATDRLPLVVALHGLGDSPDSFAQVFAGFPARARVVVPHSAVHRGDGYSWFELHGVGLAEDAPGISAMADALVTYAAEVSRARPTLGKPIFTGFSQGGALSYTIAARHPDAIRAALPVSGWLPRSLVPEHESVTVPVFAFHGTADTRVAPSFAHDARDDLNKLGFSVTLREFEGVGHAIPSETRAAVFDALARVCNQPE
jgi:phospholipase/carboxylesterase